MIGLIPQIPEGQPLRLLCIGAHSDDIEIGCGATIMNIIGRYKPVEVDWIVFSGRAERRAEALRGARHFRRNAAGGRVAVHDFRDGFFPSEALALKEVFEEIKLDLAPDLIFTHHRNDLHQDHRVISELTRNTWRNHLILEYEIPKYDGDLGQPNCFVPVTPAQVRRKIDGLVKCFPSQGAKQWFDEESFRALLRLRGLECNSPTRYAEAFHAHKLIWA